MPQRLVARVTCPSCRQQYQAPVEQILDVRADPSAKNRVLNGIVNATVCTQCGTRGALNLPFFYHDPDKELAAVYMPMQAGRDNLERQQTIGRLTTTVMDDLSPEERKGYLLQPQIFLAMENLVNKILEADGVTPEMLAEQKAKAELLQRMIDATSDEVLEIIIKENDAAIDANFFRLLTMNLEMAQTRKDTATTERFLALRSKLLNLSSEGQTTQERSKVLEALRAAPTREKLLDLLIQAPDEQVRQILVAYGRRLTDYRFFQNLTSRIEATSDEAERKRLTALRKEILTVRDQLDEETKATIAARASLLRDLLMSDDPEKLARRRFWELDEAFMNVLRANLEEAQAAGKDEIASALQAIGQLTVRLMEEATPPELRLFNRLMSAENDEEIEKVLQANRDVVTVRLVQVMEETEASMREEGELEAAEQMALVVGKARAMLLGQTVA